MVGMFQLLILMESKELRPSRKISTVTKHKSITIVAMGCFNFRRA
jgi:hypothetical protein